VQNIDAYLLLGANLGDRADTFRRATEAITEQIGPVRGESSRWETAPWGITDQPAFLNQVLCVETRLSAPEVLARLLQIERDLGRIRYEKWGARVIDLDILYFGTAIIQESDLSVPHPHLPGRRFVLAPLAELAPHFVHPVLGLTNQQLLDRCPDSSQVVRMA
jgi:2-amino-4-hydroxy-6-hydroxymethyldihydropteridine diphosphokinase